jgi:multidrug efflux pump subunit AcrB
VTGFNLSALAVPERAGTPFLILAVATAGVYAFLQLGRAEDPSFTVKVLTVTAAWPGATAREMQDLVAEPLEKRLQELRWYDRVETMTRPSVAFMTLTLKDYTSPEGSSRPNGRVMSNDIRNWASGDTRSWTPQARW